MSLLRQKHEKANFKENNKWKNKMFMHENANVCVYYNFFPKGRTNEIRTRAPSVHGTALYTIMQEHPEERYALKKSVQRLHGMFVKCTIFCYKNISIENVHTSLR